MGYGGRVGAEVFITYVPHTHRAIHGIGLMSVDTGDWQFNTVPGK